MSVNAVANDTTTRDDHNHLAENEHNDNHRTHEHHSDRDDDTHVSTATEVDTAATMEEGGVGGVKEDGDNTSKNGRAVFFLTGGKPVIRPRGSTRCHILLFVSVLDRY